MAGTCRARFTPFRWIDQKRVNLTLRQGACIYNKILCSCQSPDRAHTLDRRSPLFRFICLLNIRLNLVPLSPIRQQWISRRSRLVHLSPIRQQWISRRSRLVHLSPIRQQWISRRSRLVHLSPIRQQCISITALARFTPFRWIDQKRVNLTLRQGACIYNKILCSCRAPDRAHTLATRPLRGGHRPKVSFISLHMLAQY